MVAESFVTVVGAFDHLIELLQDSGADMEIISMIETAKEEFEYNQLDDTSEIEDYDE